MAYTGRAANGVKRIEQPAYPLVSGVNIILGDMVPDAIQVAVGIIAQDILRHILAFRRCSDLRFSRHKQGADFVFPSLKMIRRAALSPGAFLDDYLRPAAIAAGVKIEDGQRFGLHNLGHSLSRWLVNKAKVKSKTVQGILRHSRIQTTLDLYTQEDSDEARLAQGEFLKGLGMKAELVQ